MTTIPQSQNGIEHKLQMAKDAYQKGDYSAAEQLVRQILTVKPNNPQSQYLMGIVLEKLDRFEEAEDHLREGLHNSQDEKLTQRLQQVLSRVQNHAQQQGHDLDPFSEPISPTPSQETALGLQQTPSRRKRWGLRAKATALGVTLGTLPVLIVGGFALANATRNITRQIYQEQQIRATVLSETLATLAQQKLYDIETIAQYPYLTHPPAERTLAQQQQAIRFIDSVVNHDDTYGLIVATEISGALTYVEGVPLTSTKGRDGLDERVATPGSTFIADRGIDFFVAARDQRRPVIIPLRISSSSGKSSFYVAAPSIDAETDQITYVTYSRTGAEDISRRLEQQLQTITGSSDSADRFAVFVETPAYFEETEEGLKEIHISRVRREGEQVLIDGKRLGTELQIGQDVFLRENRVFATDDPQLAAGTVIDEVFGDLSDLRRAQSLETTEVNALLDQQDYLLTYAPVQEIEGLDSNWGVLVYEPSQAAFADGRRLQLTFAAGTLLAAAVVAGLGIVISNAAVRPLLRATEAVKGISQGDLSSRVQVSGDDEIAELGGSINDMADQIEELLSEQRRAREQAESQAQELQQRVLTLINEVEGAIRGDLTVKATIGIGEMGTVADFFNAIVESLRTVVQGVKDTTQQVNQSLSTSEQATQILATEISSQADEIKQTLTSVEHMTQSIQTVAHSAQQAAQMSRVASTSVQQGDEAMDKTVQGILELREVVGETTKMVKRLGESSQRISKVVSLIKDIALKTNLLAVNAGIEAANAGEEGAGFAVVAEQVGDLANRAEQATKEIEQLIESVQSQITQVVESMDQGTGKVVDSTRFVQQARENLVQLLSASHQIDQLIQGISEQTVSQAQTSETVTRLMRETAQIAERSSKSSFALTSTLHQTVEIAQKLQHSVEIFKVKTGRELI